AISIPDHLAALISRRPRIDGDPVEVIEPGALRPRWKPLFAQLDEASNERLVHYPRKRVPRWNDAPLTGIDPFEHRVSDRETDGRIGGAEKPVLPECRYAIDLDVGAKARPHLLKRERKPARDFLQ